MSKHSQKSYPTPQFKSIKSLVLSFLYGPTLTSVHEYWENHSFVFTDLWQQTDASAFKYTVSVCHSFTSKEQMPFNFMDAITIHSDFGAQKIKFVIVSNFSPSICHEAMGLDVMIFIFFNVGFIYLFIFISWRLTTLQYCSGF